MRSLDKQIVCYSYGLAKFAADIRNESHSKRHEHFYAWRIILTSVIQITVLVLAGVILNKPYEMLIAMSSFASLRLFAGGYHVRSSKHGARNCTLTSLSIMLVSIYLGSFVNIYPAIPLLIIGFILLLRFSPADDKNKPIISAKTRATNKIISIVIFLVWIKIIYHFPVYTGVTTVSLFLECLSLLSKKFNAAQH